MAKFCVGIDLGTTNSAVAYCPIDGGQIHPFSLSKENGSLPSFIYLGEEEVVGHKARVLGSQDPSKLIHSAKSWLSNPAAARKERILPLEMEGKKLSPVEATARFLTQIRKLWNRKKGKTVEEALEEQFITLTIPASFDEMARQLTLEAVTLAGFPKVTLLEEPQAAFYHWLNTSKEELPHGSTILVCDIGGGTTDFSLIEVSEKGYERMAVGSHLLLGGDNMDLALAHHLKLDLAAARTAKEEGLHSILLDGFFGLYPLDEAVQLQKGSGIKAMGLPYESEPSITKHLAAFLSKCEKKPDYVLFNGGAIKPKPFQDRLLTSLEMWFGKKVMPLQTKTLDLAVCKGAAYFGLARHGRGTRILSGLARSYYLKVEDQLLTVLPRGAEAGVEYVSSHPFTLLSNQPVSFELYHSHTRLRDSHDAFLPVDDEQILPLPEIQTVLKYGKQSKTAVHLKAAVTEIGTVELWLKSKEGEHVWKLEFSSDQKTVRQEETFEAADLDKAKKVVQDAFAIGTAQELKSLIQGLETHLEKPKNSWSPSLLRALFEPLSLQAHKRDLTSHFEHRFWNLAGFFLRPGVGHPLDEHHIKALWKVILADGKKQKNQEIEIQKWICYRRIAGGLSKGQQTQLFNALYPNLFKIKNEKYAYTEKLRALASFELVDSSYKTKLGNALIKRIEENKSERVDHWALGRLGARQLLFGSIANVVPKKVCDDWVARLEKTPWQDQEQTPFALALLTSQGSKQHPFPDKERIFGESLPSGLIL
ncbi:MAG: Chaperone protein HscA [Chlamydiales bacterium]|nr:Chaperone protein HscA [Chlamydiales bacterium]MCH9619407.1 Chaperone protein HscA [Chlamydiales bacterium]MCH9622211.1 Chaperone protein HscA [Chlamydiales bacterium]